MATISLSCIILWIYIRKSYQIANFLELPYSLWEFVIATLGHHKAGQNLWLSKIREIKQKERITVIILPGNKVFILRKFGSEDGGLCPIKDTHLF